MPEAMERYRKTENGTPVVSLESWARGIEAKEPKRDARAEGGAEAIRCALPIETRAIDEAGRTITIVAGTSGVDRYRDRIMVAGYDDTQFRRNPIMPWCHSYWDLPVAQGMNPRKEGDAYVLEAGFAQTSAIYPFAAMVWQMYSARILRMASVGGMPMTWIMVEERRGMDITDFDLWEVSLCPLGVNPDAMAKAELNGIDAHPMDEWARQVLDEGGSIFLPKAKAEAVVKALGYGKGLALFEMEPDAIEALQRGAGTDTEPKKKPIPKAEDEPAAEDPPAEDEPKEEAAEPEKEDEPEADPEEPVAECADEDEIALDLEALAAEVEEAEGGESGPEDEEIEVDDDELQAAVQTAVSGQLAALLSSQPLRVEAR